VSETFGPEPTTSPAAVGPAPDASRLHPLTPLLRGIKVLGVLAAIVTQQTLTATGTGPAMAVVAVAVPLAFLAGYLSWRFTSYRIEGGDLRLETGVLFRRSRRVPLARLQAVDVVRPLFARALGLAELRLEVVGAGQAEAPLAYLSEPDAHRLRARLLALSAGVSEDAPEPDEQVLVVVPTTALVVSVLLGVPLILTAAFVVVLAVTVIIDPVLSLGVLAGVLAPAALSVGGLSVRRLLTEYGFTLAQSPDGLRLRSGLLETRAQTVPPDRVQAVRISQPLLWRRRDWVRVEVDVAGYGREGSQSLGAALLPVAPRGLAESVLERVLPDLFPGSVPLRPAPQRARWLDWLQWSQLAVGVDERRTVVRSGWARRVLVVVPHAKVQSVRDVQGPLQRRLGLASVSVDSAGRTIAASARHRDEGEARQLVDEISARATAARAAGRAAGAAGRVAG